jgi:hypothetical protein
MTFLNKHFINLFHWFLFFVIMWFWIHIPEKSFDQLYLEIKYLFISVTSFMLVAGLTLSYKNKELTAIIIYAAVFVIYFVSPYLLKNSLILPMQGNFDIYNYILNSKMLSGPLLSTQTFIIGEAEWLEKIKGDNFGSFLMLNLLSRLFSIDAIYAAILLIAILFVSTCWLCKNIFQILLNNSFSQRSFIFLSLQFCLSPLLFYIFSQYFLGQIISNYLFLYSLFVILKSSEKKLYLHLIPTLGILFYTYSTTFLFYVIIIFMLVLFIEKNKFKSLVNLAYVVAALIILSVLQSDRTNYLMKKIFGHLSSQDGWSLDFISPFSLLGLTLWKKINFIQNDFAIFISIILFSFFLRHLNFKATIISSTLKILLHFYVFFWFCYIFAFFTLGKNSYTQWKFASFFPLMFSFSIGLVIYKTYYRKIIYYLMFISLIHLNYQLKLWSGFIDAKVMTASSLNLNKNIGCIYLNNLPAEINMIFPSILTEKILVINGPGFYETKENYCQFNDNKLINLEIKLNNSSDKLFLDTGLYSFYIKENL